MPRKKKIATMKIGYIFPDKVQRDVLCGVLDFKSVERMDGDIGFRIFFDKATRKRLKEIEDLKSKQKIQCTVCPSDILLSYPDLDIIGVCSKKLTDYVPFYSIQNVAT